jgi:hypothetical protein
MWSGGNAPHGGKPIKIGSRMEFDVTQWWVPAAVLSVLCVWIVLAALLEMRKPLEVAVESNGSEGVEKSEDSSEANAPVEAKADATQSDAAKPEPAPTAKKKRSFLFRTSWFWGPLLIGALAQLYLNHIA